MVVLALVLALSPWGHAATVLEPEAPEAPAAPPASPDAELMLEPQEERSALRDGPSTEERQAEAGEAFLRGVQAFKEKRFEDAQRDFTEAQRLAPHADTLYNLGLAQQKLDDHVAAWRSFEQLLQDTDQEPEREDIVAAQAASRPHVAWLRVRANTEGIVCLDGQPMPANDGVPTLLTTPGPHRLDVGREYRPLDLRGGEDRTMELQLAPARPPAPPRRALRVLAGLSIGATAAAGGLGLGAGLVDDDTARLGMGLGAAFTGTLALTTSVIALVVHHRARHWTPPPPLRSCPP